MERRSVDLFRVIKPGLFSTVQDLGRFGFQRFGVPVSGAMDKYAFICANMLVGNHDNDACLEVTLLGPELEVLNTALVAVAGAEFSLSLNGADVPMWQTLHLKKGDIISFVGSARSGCRAYLAVKGGIDVPLVLKSRSTYVRGGFGGYEGRALKTGDIIKAFVPQQPLKTLRVIPSEQIPHYEREFTVHVVMGPQEDMFTTKGVATFFSNVYTVTPNSDRMGYRLEGAPIEHKTSTEPLTDALTIGAVQVPRNGKPIVLMADAQTTGGYPKIAAVITPDVYRLAQAKPNDKIHFQKISQTQAHAKYIEFQKTLNQLKTQLKNQ